MCQGSGERGGRGIDKALDWGYGEKEEYSRILGDCPCASVGKNLGF
jgi:hypothetical protein